MAPRRPAHRARSRRIKRALAVAGLALVAFLYQQPLRTYLDTRRAVAERSAEVHALAEQRRRLEQRLVFETSDTALLREARRLGYVKPGERLFIVKGIERWRRARAEQR